jgi:hypothetical protein
VRQNHYGYILHRIREEKQNNPHSCHFLRETFHQHFPGGGNGVYQKPAKVQEQSNHSEDQVCINEAHYNPGDLNATLLDPFPEVPVLNYSTLDQGAGRFHSGNIKIFIDCSHWCWSTRFYDPLWYLFLGALRETCPWR